MTPADYPTRVQIATPVYQGVQPAMVDSLLELIFGCLKSGIPCKWDHVTYSSIEFARSELLGRFLSENATHLLFLDSDNAIPFDVLRRMIATELDIVSIVCPLRQEPEKLNFQTEGAVLVQTVKGHPVFEISNSGLACVLVRRHVLEKLYELHPELMYTSLPSGGVARCCALFNHIVREDIYHGEDGSFFLRARAAGFKLHALFDAPIRHDMLQFNFSDYARERAAAEALARGDKAAE